MVDLCQVFPPKPGFTEQHLPDQTGKVFIITGATSGVGLELAKILYQKNGTIYVAARSQSKIEAAVKEIREEVPSGAGRLEHLLIDLSDLRTVKAAAERFLSRENRLDVLFHNAGIMFSANDAKGAQDHELRMATNCLGPHLLTHLLRPLLSQTAMSEPDKENQIRIVWVSSMIQLGTPKGGIIWDAQSEKPKLLEGMDQYMQTKAGVVFLAHEWGEQLGTHGIVSVSLHPGLMKTELQRDVKVMQTMMGMIFKPAKFGAYTELFAGFSPDVTAELNGSFLLPWGRFGSIPKHMAVGMKGENQGGTGSSKKFWTYCEVEIASFK